VRSSPGVTLAAWIGLVPHQNGTGGKVLLHHSERGSQYTSEPFQRLMADHGVVCSMSRSGNVWDNAAMESFFSSLKTERTARKVYRSRDEAKADVSITLSASTQSETQALDDRVFEPYGVRETGWISLSGYQPNHVLCLMRSRKKGYAHWMHGEFVEASGTERIYTGIFPNVRAVSTVAPEFNVVGVRFRAGFEEQNQLVF
jgi:hypothetical protein